MPRDWNAARLAARSGPARAEWAARFEADGEIMDSYAIAEAPLADPVLAAIARSGRLSIDGAALDAANDRERTRIAGFFEACR